MKKKLLLFVMLILAADILSGVSARAQTQVSAEAAVLMEAETGTVLFEKNPDSQMLVASTTKIMTALVAIENCGLDETASVKLEQILVEGSSMYLRDGEEITVGNLLYGLLLCSGNDAASVLAYHTAGSIEAFAEMMNAKARELGMTNSSFKNPHGLDEDGHYSTARDMAVLMSAAMERDEFEKIVSTKSISVAGRSLTNHNRLLWSCDGVIGGKTGYTMSAGRTLVSCAEREGMRLICVTLNAPSDWNDHAALYDYGFGSYRFESIVRDGETIGEVPVISGLSDAVEIVATEDFSILLSSEKELTVTAYTPKFVYAWVIGGEIAGKIIVEVDGETVEEIALVYRGDVALDNSIRLNFWERLKWGWHRAAKHSMINFTG